MERRETASTPEYAARLAQRLRDVHGSVAEIVRTAATKTGVQLTMPPEQFAVIATALVDGFTAQHQLDPASAPPHLLSDAIEMLWDAATREADATRTGSVARGGERP